MGVMIARRRRERCLLAAERVRSRKYRSDGGGQKDRRFTGRSGWRRRSVDQDRIQKEAQERIGRCERRGSASEMIDFKGEGGLGWAQRRKLGGGQKEWISRRD